MLDAAEKRFESKRKEDLAVAKQAARYYDQQVGRLMVAANERAGQ
jgi:hypothetical protein